MPFVARRRQVSFECYDVLKIVLPQFTRHAGSSTAAISRRLLARRWHRYYPLYTLILRARKRKRYTAPRYSALFFDILYIFDGFRCYFSAGYR
jgi:hypothetical protein